MTHLSTSVWLSIPQETRWKIANIFGISRSSHFEVQDNRVISDGYTPSNLEGITVDAMQAFTNSKEDDFYKLFTKVIEKVEKNELKEEPKTDDAPARQESTVGITDKKRTGSVKKA